MSKVSISIPEDVSQNFETSLVNHFKAYVLRFTRSKSMTHPNAAALRRIMRRYVRDLLGYNVNMEVPDGYDMVLKDVGSSIYDIVNDELLNVHMCMPDLDIRDHIRRERYLSWLYSHKCPVSNAHTQICTSLRNGDARYRCESKAQVCRVTAPWIVMMHSAYDLTPEAIVDCMIAADAVRCVMILHYDDTIFTGSRKGKNIQLGFSWINYYVQKFPDAQACYRHRLDVYISKFVTPLVIGADGRAYLFEFKEVIFGTAVIEVFKRGSPYVIGGVLTFPLPSTAPKDTITVYTWEFTPGFEHGLMGLEAYSPKLLKPVVIRVPAKFFYDCMKYGYTVESGKFVLATMVRAVTAISSRRNIGGTFMSEPDFELDQSQLLTFASTMYLILYQIKYNNSQGVATSKNVIDQFRSDSSRSLFVRIMINLFKRDKHLDKHPYYNEDLDNVVNSIPMSSYDKSVIDNAVLSSTEYGFLNPRTLEDDKSFVNRFIKFLNEMGRIRKRAPILVHDSTYTVEYTVKIPSIALKPCESVKHDEVLSDLCADQKYDSDVNLISSTDKGNKCEKEFNVVSVPGDGNCVYNCFVKAELFPDIDVTKLKTRLISSYFMQDVLDYAYVREQSCDSRVITEFKKSLTSSGEWGNEYTMLLIAKTFGVRICIHSFTDDRYSNNIVISNGISSDGCKTIHLRYSGNHYDLLVPVDTTLLKDGTVIMANRSVVSVMKSFVFNDTTSPFDRLMNMINGNDYTKDRMLSLINDKSKNNLPLHRINRFRSSPQGKYKSLLDLNYFEILHTLRQQGAYDFSRCFNTDGTKDDISHAFRRFGSYSEIFCTRAVGTSTPPSYRVLGVNDCQLECPYYSEKFCIASLVSELFASGMGGYFGVTYSDLVRLCFNYPYVSSKDRPRTSFIERRNKIHASWSLVSHGGYSIFRIGVLDDIDDVFSELVHLYSNIKIFKPVTADSVSLDMFLICSGKHTGDVCPNSVLSDFKDRVKERFYGYFINYYQSDYGTGFNPDEIVDALTSNALSGGGNMHQYNKVIITNALSKSRTHYSSFDLVKDVVRTLKPDPRIIGGKYVLYDRLVSYNNLIRTEFISSDCYLCTCGIGRLIRNLRNKLPYFYVADDATVLYGGNHYVAKGIDISDANALDTLRPGFTKHLCFYLVRGTCCSSVDDYKSVLRFLCLCQDLDIENITLIMDCGFSLFVYRSIITLFSIFSVFELSITTVSGNVCIVINTRDIDNDVFSQLVIGFSLFSELKNLFSFDAVHKLFLDVVKKNDISIRKTVAVRKPRDIPKYLCLADNVEQYAERPVVASDTISSSGNCHVKLETRTSKFLANDFLKDINNVLGIPSVNINTDNVLINTKTTNTSDRIKALTEYKSYLMREKKHSDSLVGKTADIISSFTKGLKCDKIFAKFSAKCESPIAIQKRKNDKVGIFTATGIIIKQSDPIVTFQELNYVFDIATRTVMSVDEFKKFRSALTPDTLGYYALFTSTVAHNQLDSMIEALNDAVIASGGDSGILNSVHISWLQALPGAGKTHYLVETLTKDDLVVTPTSENRDSFRTRFKKSNPSFEGLDSRVRTINGFLVDYQSKRSIGSNPLVNKNTRLLVDEAIMYHSGAIFALCILYRVSKVICVGDRLQIPFISRIDMSVSYEKIIDFVDQHLPPLPRTFRCPLDVTVLLQDIYSPYLPEGVIVQCKSSYQETVCTRELVTVRNNKFDNNFLSMVLPGIDHAFNHENGDPRIRFLCFIREDLLTLRNNFSVPEKYCCTVNQFQGCQADFILVFRFSEANKQIYTDKSQVIVALTRHTRKLVYCSVKTQEPDLLRDWIKRSVSVKEMERHLSLSAGGGKYDIPEHIDYVSIPHKDRLKTDKFFFIGSKRPCDLIVTEHVTMRYLLYLIERFAPVINRRRNLILDRVILMRYEQQRLKPAIKRLLEPYVGIYTNFHSGNLSSTVFEVIERNGVEHTPGMYQDREFDQSVLSNWLNESKSFLCENVKDDVVLSLDHTDYINELQFMLSCLFPSCIYRDTYLDAWMTYNFDLDISVSDISFSSIRFVTPERKYNCMIPKLSFTSPVVRTACLVESLIAVQKRNRNVPDIKSDVCPYKMSDKLFSRFVECYLDMNLYEQIHYGPGEVSEWLKQQKNNVVNHVVGEYSIYDAEVDKYSLITKGAPKPTLSDDAYCDFAAPQVVLFPAKDINAVFCVIFRSIKRSILRMMETKPHIRFFTDMDPDELADYFSVYVPTDIFGNKASLEVDIKKYDKSQDLVALLFECNLMRFFKVPEELIHIWFMAHVESRVKDQQSSLKFKLKLQRRSGDAATLLGNTLFLMSVMAYVYKVEDLDLATFVGDDSLLVGDAKLLHHDSSDFANLFNLDVKFFRYKYYHFCSKFLIPVQDRWYLIPDPVKLLVRLSRFDLLNWTHIDEYQISLVDSTKYFGSRQVVEVLSQALTERYGPSIDFTDYIPIIRSVILDLNRFRNLFEEPLIDKYPEGSLLPADR
ncbi:replicase [Pistachio virus Y]|uniref:Replicase n=1 Tax=Pistachio virus Y TaxID=2794239 RepID=A0A7T0M802_9VIRU|nr:replicase [Pistachio virus Y]